MKKVLVLVLVLLMAFTLSACSGKSNDGNSVNGGDAVSNDSGTRIQLSFNNENVIVRMHDNPTSKDFLALLPLTLKLEDYVGTEKICYLPRQLSTQGAPSGNHGCPYQSLLHIVVG